MINVMTLDFLLVGGFMALWVAVILFRRFHQFECAVNQKEIGPTAWGLYGTSVGKGKELN